MFRPLVWLFFVASAISLRSATDVTFYAITKSISYAQSDATTVAVAAGQPYSIKAMVTLSSPSALTNSTLTLPGGLSTQSLNASTNQTPPQFKLRARYGSQAAMDGAYPNGSYVITNYTAHDGVRASTLTLTGDSFPVTPLFTNFSAAQAVNPAAAFTVRWNPFTGGTAADIIVLSINTAGGTTIYSTPQPGEAGTLDGTATSAIIPANTLAPGQSYFAQVTFAKVVYSNTTDYPGARGIAAYTKDTTMSLITSAGGGGPTLAANVAPAITSNTYAGNVTLNISGLAASQSVTVQKYVDANQNGVVDGADVLIEQFVLTDGQETRVGGVRDLNIPGDDDGLANGQISAGSYFPGWTEAGRSAATFLYKVSNGSSTVTAPFVVNQTPASQRITGTVLSSGTPVANAFVILLKPVGNDMRFSAGTVADASGNFSLTNPPDSYVVIAFKSGYTGNFSSLPMVTLAPGQSISTNVNLTVADRTIVGRSVDAANTNSGIGPIQMFCGSDSGDVTLAFGDASGNFSIPVVSGHWKLDISEASLRRLGYLRAQEKASVDVTGGSVSNGLILLTRAQALVYGTVTDGFGAPVAGIEITGGDLANQFSATGMSDGAGRYSIAISTGDWNVSPANDVLAALGYISTSAQVNLTAGQAQLENFTLMRATAHLRGRVVDSLGNPVANMTMVIWPLSTGNGGTLSPVTIDDGTFDAGVSAATWNVGLECSAARQRGLVGPNLQVPVTDGVDQNVTLVALATTAQITGFVRDTNGSPVAGLSLDASMTLNGTNYNAGCIQTDASGAYQMSVANGPWTISLRADELSARGFNPVSSRNTTINGANAVLNFTVQPIDLRAQLGQYSRPFNTQFLFWLNGIPGRSYTIQYSTTLTNWFDLMTTTIDHSPYQVVDSNANSSGRFYRVRLNQ